MSKQKVIVALEQPSTWRGIVKLFTALAAGFNVSVSPELASQIVIAGVGLSGLIGAICSD